MTMTREEAIELVCYGDWLNILMLHLGDDDINRLAEAMCIIGNALRPVSRERVEKVWRGEWVDLREAYNDVPKCQCSRCGKVIIGLNEPFCKSCGAPMTDEAVEIVVERMKELKWETF